MNIKDLIGRYEMEVPGNGLSQTGIDAIQQLLCDWGLAKIPEGVLMPPSRNEVWKWDWKVPGKGEYVGTLPKRLAKLVYQSRKVKLTPEQLTEVGNIGSAHSGKHRHFWFDIVAHANWERTDFSQPSDCCFWSCHASAKKMILKAGGGAIRFFVPNNGVESVPACGFEYVIENGIARAWIVPAGDCWVVFNGYGIEALETARILAAHLGHAYYKRVKLRNNGESSGDLWINGGSGFLVGPQESVLQFTSIDLDLPDIEETLECSECETEISGDEVYGGNIGSILCEDCYHESYFDCECGRTVCREDTKEGANGEDYCEHCWERMFISCASCSETVSKQNARSFNDEHYCNECFANFAGVCERCDTVHPLENLTEYGGKPYCSNCTLACTECGEEYYGNGVEELQTGNSGKALCPVCYREETEACLA